MSSTVSTAASSPVTKNLTEGPDPAAAMSRKFVSPAKESTDDHNDESCNSHMESTDDGRESHDSDYDAEAESNKILVEMETISRQVQESEFYSKLNKQIKSEEFQSQLSRVTHEHDVLDLPMVIYALGSLESNSSKHQLAVALLLQQDLSNWIINRIEVFDPVLSPADVIVLQKLGCTVLSVDDWRQIGSLQILTM